uniref:Uncharacterized protein n=1 Tax=Passer montanus parvoviridae sp. TaxID=2794522 RepID=A0A8A4XDK7_9VIRU|nr:MAG: hypothetical protein [Passer montanus parvoviridae sp.]
MARNFNITFEPCTLVYTLLDPTVLPFDDFSLLIRSLHTYMVDSITPNPNQNNVHVKLNYQASTVNAQKKLGSLADFVHISKLSSFVKETEFSRLAELQKQFGIQLGGDTPDAAPTPYRAPRGAGRGRRVFPNRVHPYAKATKAPPTVVHQYSAISEEEPEETPGSYQSTSFDHENQQQEY